MDDSLFDFALPERDLACRVIAGRGHYEAVIKGIRRAKHSVWVATANLKELMIEGPRSARTGRYRSVLALLAELHHRGVELRLLHAGVPSRAFRRSFDRFPELVEGGLSLRQCPRVHLKLVIVDAEWVYLGSANWTGAGLGAKSDRKRNFEIGICSSDFDLLDRCQAMYDALWRGTPCSECGLRDQCEAPLDST